MQRPWSAFLDVPLPSARSRAQQRKRMPGIGVFMPIPGADTAGKVRATVFTRGLEVWAVSFRSITEGQRRSVLSGVSISIDHQALSLRADEVVE